MHSCIYCRIAYNVTSLNNFCSISFDVLLLLKSILRMFGFIGQSYINERENNFGAMQKIAKIFFKNKFQEAFDQQNFFFLLFTLCNC